MKLSLLQLERQYLNALSEFGEHAPQTISTCITLVETLNQTGRYFISQKQYGDKYLQRAIDLVRPFQMEELLLIKYQTYMLYAEYFEYSQQNKSAYNLLNQLLPLPQTADKEIIMTQIQILNHIIENGRLCKITDIVALNEQLITLMESVGLTFYLCKQFQKKFQLILLQALSFQAKIYLKLGKEREAAQLYFQSYHLSEELLGIHEKRTQEYRKIYEQLNDKMSINIEMEEEEEEEELKPNVQMTTPRDDILTSVRPKIHSMNNYIINVDSVRAPKLSKRVNKEVTQKQTQMKVHISVKDFPLQSVFIIKNQPKRPMSSQQTTKMTSPTRQVSFLSKKTSDRHKKLPSCEQSAMKELEDMQPVNLLNDLIMTRPTYDQVVPVPIYRKPESAKYKKQSTYQIQLLAPTNSSRPQIREPSKAMITLKLDTKKPSNVPSSQNIQRPSQKKIIPSEAIQTNANIRGGSTRNLPSEQEEDIPRMEENLHYSFEVNKPTESSYDPIIAKFLETHSMEVLLEAVERIKSKLKNRLRKPKPIVSTERKLQHSPTRQANKLMNRQNTMIEIVEKKIQENEASKIIFKFFQSANLLEWYPVHFYDKLFTDFETSKWVLENPRFKGQCLQRNQEKDQFQQVSMETIQNILSSGTKSVSLQVIGSIELSNHTRKIQMRFQIDSLSEHYKDIQPYDDLMDLFDQLLNIYLQQEDLFNEWLDFYKEKTLYRASISKHAQLGQRRSSTQLMNKEKQLEIQNVMQFYQYLLSKILFLLGRQSYIKTMNGYKFKQETNNLQNQIQLYNNQIYLKRRKRIKNYFTYYDLILESEARPKQKVQKKSHRKRYKDRHLFIANKPEDSADEQQSVKETPYISLKDTGIILGSELLSKQLIVSGGDTPLMERPVPKPIAKSNWRNANVAQVEQPPELKEIFSPEIQDYLFRYFPEFHLNIPPQDYHPTSISTGRKAVAEYNYVFRQERLSQKYEQLEYKPIHSENYLILTQIVKIEKQFYYLTLTNKLHLKQIFTKDVWEDELSVQLNQLIKYQVGRTGYIIDLIELQNILQQKLEIVNCKVQLKQDETDTSQKKKSLKLYRDNRRLYYIKESMQFVEEGLKEMSQFSDSQQEDSQDYIEEQKRQPLIDIVFLLGVLNNNHVVYSNYLTPCYLLKHEDQKLRLAETELPRKPRFPFRLILSHEDMNKHISRTNEQTINAKDISLFPNFNSVFLVRKQQFIYKPVGVKLLILSDINKLHQDIRNDKAAAKLLIYCNNSSKVTLYLTSEQTERWAHLFQVDGTMKYRLFGFKTMLKKTLTGKQLFLNQDRHSQSQDLRFLLLQDKVLGVKQYFIQTKIKQLGHVFVTAKIHQLMLLTIMPAGNKSKAHVFLYPIQQEDPIKLMYTLCNQFVVLCTKTYSKLELMPITQNKIRKQYLLSNQFHEKNILLGQRAQSRVVYKQIRRIDKSFFIITVTLISNYFQIYLYNQNNCRKFCFKIHQSDFTSMNQYFLDSIFPEQPDEVVEQFFRPWKLQEINKIYTLISRAPETFRTRTQQYIQQLQNKKLKRSATSNYANINSFQRQSTLQIAKEESSEDEDEKTNKKCWLYGKLLMRKDNSVFEKKLWMEILKQMNITQNIIMIDKFKVTLQEIVFSNDRMCNFVCYMPCHEVQQSYRWQPIRLRIHSYNSCKTYDVPINSRGKQVQVAKQCMSLLHSYTKDDSIPSNQELMKVNKRNDKQYIKYQLLYKGAFMKNEMLIIAIYLCDERFLVRIYNQTNFITRKLEIYQVELKVPYIRQLLILNPLEAGRRLCLMFRNNFIHASFLSL